MLPGKPPPAAPYPKTSEMNRRSPSSILFLMGVATGMAIGVVLLIIGELVYRQVTP